ncbi:family 78 glycoside hydrolase catalytic domain [Arthrobacter sp. B10-11]|uniref:family 78 glycoside hydrolase catalytic domain n=1 Tax=Arthrobacter sp. B10-11 TaxID=3081160 RepID=UPI002954C404|nr:family 78 glycoside hydrolase catalytic domain [Arthrobacter sp. B10-11]MDV8147643.1 family 78 glycoside hydrolase catalytic domain [Arthrobacter sp. B10-11]
MSEIAGPAAARLRTNQLAEAFGITGTAPRFSWTPPQGTVRQAAYQLTASNGWDTGRVASDAHRLVPYDGPVLRSRDRFEWKVRTWNVAPDGTEVLSGWAEPMSVELGLLHPGDWLAQWIGPDEHVVPAPGQRPGYALHREFALAAVPDSARAYATAHGIYELFINGRRVGDQQLTPGSTSYHSTLQVQAFDITRLLRPGSNTVRAVLTDGWFRGSFGFTRDADMYGTQTAFLAQLELESAETRTVIGTDGSWLVSGTEIVSADLMEGQRVDLRSAAAEGTEARPAALREGSYATLSGPVAPPTRIVEELVPASITRLGNGHQMVDLGQNINGWVRLSRLGARGTEVTLVHGETLDVDGDVSQDHLRPIDFTKPGQFLAAGQVDSVVSAGAPEGVFEPRHTVHGFRYVSVRGLAETLGPADISGCMVQTDLERLGTFSCSDGRLNKLHGIVEWSFRDNACEVPTDCPQREKAGWTGDWQLFVPTAAYLFDVAGFSRKWLNDVRADQWDNGVVANISPSPGPAVTGAEFMAFTNGSSGWGDAVVMVPWEIYLATGDTGILEENWDAMNRWLGFVRSTAEGNRHPARAAAEPAPAPHEQYLWDTGFHFGEWMEPGGPAPDLFAARSMDNGIVATAYYRHSAALMAGIAAVLGRDAEARELGELSGNVRRAWQQEYLLPDGTVRDKTGEGGTQANCVRALAFDLVPETARTAVTGQLATLVREAGTHLGTGFLATPYLLPALADNGRLDLAYELLMQDSEPSWLVMVDRGATTVWEDWNGIGADGSPKGSLNHYSKGAVASFLHRYTAGLRQSPGSAGWERIIIEPRPGAGLTSASTSHRGPQGLINIEWAIDDGVLALTAALPSGTTAEVRLPGGPAAVVGPGTHSFTAAMPGSAMPAGAHTHPDYAGSTP